jgi:hypothetical protein
VVAAGAIKPSDPRIVSAMEGELRTRVFEGLLFYRDNIPGFENAFLVGIQPFMGTRGGPHMVGDVTLRVKDVFSELRFDDVLYRNIHESNHGGPASGFDVPLRITLPKGVDGLMVCGRGAAYERRGHDPSGMRARPSMMVFGQCVGTVAALAALDGVTPRKVDIRKVQRRLLRDGIPLGEPARLRELGLRA